jgi:glycosyltransferase involved in cell wall biosynthesis
VSGSDGKTLTVQIVNAWEDFGGAALAAHRLYRALRASDVDASMLVHGKNSDDPDVRLPDYGAVDPGRSEERERLIAEELAQFGAGFNGLGTFGLDRSALGCGLVDAIRPDTAIVNLHWVGNFIDWELFFARGAIKVPVVWTLHDMRPLTGGCHYAGACRNYRTGCGMCPYFEPARAEDLTRRAAQRERRALESWGGSLHIVTPSRWLADEAASSTVLAGVPVTVIPNSVDLEEFRPLPQAAARAALGLPETAKVVFFVAHDLADRRKGAPHLAEALAGMSDIGDLHVITAGAQPPQLPSFVTHHPTGLLTDAAQLGLLYAAADLVVLPTLEDNLPNVILEAFASGRPVVGYDIGGVPDHVLDGVTGFLVPYASPAALTEALREALGDRDRLAILGRACRAHAEREFAPQVQAARYRALFNSLSGAGALP